MKPRPSWLLASLLIGALTACGPTPEPTPGEPTWTGELTINSSSVPSPYNWRRSASLTAAGAQLSVHYSPRESEPGEQADEQWSQILGDQQWAQVDDLVREFGPEPAVPSDVGVCWATIALTSAQGDAVDLSASPGDPNWTTALELWAVLAGPDDFDLPRHANECPTR